MGFEPLCPNQPGLLHSSAPQRMFYTLIFLLFQKEHQPSVGATGHQQARASPQKHLSSPLHLHPLWLCTFQNNLFWKTPSVDALRAESLPPLLSASFGRPLSGPCHMLSNPPSSWGTLPTIVCRLEFVPPPPPHQVGGEAVARARPCSVFPSQVTADRSLSTPVLSLCTIEP